MERILAALERENAPFTVFGGEPLLLPREALEQLFEYGHRRFGRNAIQTNAVLLGEQHLAMLRRYNVSVGVSIDGPGPLNDARWAGSLEKTRTATEQSERAIELLCEEGIPPSLITTLSKSNGTRERLPILVDWFDSMARIGIKSVRLHILETESAEVSAALRLSDAEYIEAFKQLQPLSQRLGLDMFRDIDSLLRGSDKDVTCTFAGCDPLDTRAVRGIEGNGTISSCGRTNKDGVDFVKATPSTLSERMLALYYTPQTHGGCNGCRFFLACKGQCPGTAIDGDWRNRSSDCAVWYSLFESAETRLLGAGEVPYSLRPDLAALEAAALSLWSKGDHVRIAKLIK